MLERRLRTVICACTVIGLLASCSHFTTAGRQQLAYAKYVRKQTHNRVKMTTKYKKMKVPKAASSEPKMSGTAEGPQSVGSQEVAPKQAPPPSSQVPENQ